VAPVRTAREAGPVAAALARLVRRHPAPGRPGRRLCRRRLVTAPRRPARLLSRPRPPDRRIAAKARVTVSVRASARPGLAPVRPRFAQVRCPRPLARPRPPRRCSRPSRCPVRPPRPRLRRPLRRSAGPRRPPGRGLVRRGLPRPPPRRSSSRSPRAPATPLWCRRAGSRRSRGRGHLGWATTRSASVPALPRRDRLHPDPARRALRGSSRRPARVAVAARVTGLPAEPAPAPLVRAVLGRTPA